MTEEEKLQHTHRRVCRASAEVEGKIRGSSEPMLLPLGGMDAPEDNCLHIH